MGMVERRRGVEEGEEREKWRSREGIGSKGWVSGGIGEGKGAVVPRQGEYSSS